MRKEADIEKEIERLREEFARRREPQSKKVAPVIEPKRERLHVEPFESGSGEGSEPWLREDEAVCPVTHLTYNKHLPTSPHVDLEAYKLH